MNATVAPVRSAEQSIYQFAAAPGPARPGAAARCYAAGLAGLQVSEDGGRTWADAFQTMGLKQPLPTLAVAAAETEVFVGYNGGLLRSLDGGATWHTIPFAAPPPALAVLALAPNYAADGTLFAGTLADGIYYSTDRGAHWRTGNLGLIDLNVLCLALAPDFPSQPVVFAGTQSGLFCSRTAGRSWREVELPSGYDAVLSLACSPDFARDGTLYAGTETHGLLVSIDGGQQWRRVAAVDLTQAVSQIKLGPQFPRQPKLLVLHEGRLLVSDDGGAAWQPWPGLAALPDDMAVTAFMASRGFDPGAPVLVGLDGGDIRQVNA
jgi:photosystem II stability/assembly factor-like uncharacterized protein